MDLKSLRQLCLSLPHATEDVQWGDDLLFRIGGKIFASVTLEPEHGCRISLKTTPEKFAELLERSGTMPAPYVGRYHWIGLEDFNTLPRRELEALVRESYLLVAAKLTRKPARKRPQRKKRKKRSN